MPWPEPLSLPPACNSVLSSAMLHTSRRLSPHARGHAPGGGYVSATVPRLAHCGRSVRRIGVLPVPATPTLRTLDPMLPRRVHCFAAFLVPATLPQAPLWSPNPPPFLRPARSAFSTCLRLSTPPWPGTDMAGSDLAHDASQTDVRPEAVPRAARCYVWRSTQSAVRTAAPRPHLACASWTAPGSIFCYMPMLSC